MVRRELTLYDTNIVQFVLVRSVMLRNRNGRQTGLSLIFTKLWCLSKQSFCKQMWYAKGLVID